MKYKKSFLFFSNVGSWITYDNFCSFVFLTLSSFSLILSSLVRIKFACVLLTRKNNLQLFFYQDVMNTLSKIHLPMFISNYSFFGIDLKVVLVYLVYLSLKKSKSGRYIFFSIYLQFLTIKSFKFMRMEYLSFVF